MNDFQDKLNQLGLQQYHDSFVEEGFDTWETLLDITEADLESLHVKLGHRRKLQRAIAESRGHGPEKALPLGNRRASLDASYNSDDSFHGNATTQNRNPATGSNAGGTKRKYRRHPKPDENAPERPASAYVIFSNQIREEVKGRDLSFTEIAKTVGERWQVLDPAVRERYEKQAGVAKEKYYADLSAYKRTEAYAQYQGYLAEFRAKHGLPTEGKRARLETQQTSTSLSTQSSYGENPDMLPEPSTSSSYSDALRRGEPSPSTAYPRTSYSSQALPSASVSPSMSGLALASPTSREPYSPLSSMPPSTGPNPFDLPHHAKQSAYTDIRRPDSMHIHSGGSAPVTSAGPRPIIDPLPIGPYSRVPLGPDLRIPMLNNQDTHSSESSVSGISSFTGSLLPVLDAPKEQRMLPQPVPMAIGSTPNPPLAGHLPLVRGSDHYLMKSTDRPPMEGQWPALLRATELARDADMGTDQSHMDRGDIPKR